MSSRVTYSLTSRQPFRGLPAYAIRQPGERPIDAVKRQLDNYLGRRGMMLYTWTIDCWGDGHAWETWRGTVTTSSQVQGGGYGVCAEIKVTI